MSDDERNERDAMTWPPRQEHAGEDEPGQLTKQTPGLDPGPTEAVAGPDWDQALVDREADRIGGTPIEGDVKRGASREGQARGG